VFDRCSLKQRQVCCGTRQHNTEQRCESTRRVTPLATTSALDIFFFFCFVLFVLFFLCFGGSAEKRAMRHDAERFDAPLFDTNDEPTESSVDARHNGRHGTLRHKQQREER
jgi:hypothetical protein